MVRAAVMREPRGKIVIEEFPYPELEENALTLRTLYSEVCGTDVHLHHGRLARVPYPIIPGHISVGTVEEKRGSLRDVYGREIEKGEIVTFFDVHEPTREGWMCDVAKANTRNPARKVYGITYSSNDGLLGGWSEVIHIKKGVKVVPLEKGFDPLLYIGGGCGLITAFHAVERADVKLGDTVVVQGAGPVGLSALAWARLAGAYKIIAVGAPEFRLDVAKKMGADEVVNIDDLDPETRVEKIYELTGGFGADVTIECSGNPHAVKEGLLMTRDAGSYLIVGQYTDAGDIMINPHRDINKKHLDIKGCWGFDFSHMHKAVKMMEKFHGEFSWELLMSKLYSLNEVNEALSAVENLEVVKAVIEPNKS